MDASELDEEFFRAAEERVARRKSEERMRRAIAKQAPTPPPEEDEGEDEEESPVITLPKPPKPPKPERVFPDYPVAPACVHYWHIRLDGSRECLNCGDTPSPTQVNRGYRGVAIYPTSSFALNAIEHPERCREEKDYTEMPDPVRWVSMSDFHRRHRP